MICRVALGLAFALAPALRVEAQSLEELAERQKALIAEQQAKKVEQTQATPSPVPNREPDPSPSPTSEHTIAHGASSTARSPRLREFPTISSSDELPSPSTGTLIRGAFVVRSIRPHSSVKGRFNVLLADISGKQFALEGIASSAASAVTIGQLVYAKSFCPLEIIGKRQPNLYLVRPYVGWLDDQP